MQPQLADYATDVPIELFAVNEAGFESGLAGMGALGPLPILQDTEALDIWNGLGITYRDVLILDEDGVWVTTYNLTANNLSVEAKYQELLSLLVTTAGGDAPEFGPDLVNGQANYEAYCAMCHGLDGEGYVSDNANQLANPTFLATATDDFIASATVHGRPGTAMSGWGADWSGPLSDADVADVVGYIRSWQTTTSVTLPDTPIAGDPLVGEVLYDANCSGCHGPEGQGGPYPSVTNPWLLATASDAFLQYAVLAGRPGTPMPGYSATLSSAQVAHLISYLRAFEVPVSDVPPPPWSTDFSQPFINPGGELAALTPDANGHVAAADVAAAIDEGKRLVVLDVRTPSDYLLGHVSGALSVPFYDIEGVAELLPEDTWIVTYCGCPHTLSGLAKATLEGLGFTKVALIDEGYFVWEGEGYPVTTGSTP